jgi:formylglycine-generating enzyme required for sulfatase activity
MKSETYFRTTLAALLLVAVSIVFCTSEGRTELPVEVRKEQYILAVAKHRENGDWAKALQYIDKLDKLNVALPANFDFYRGETEYNLKRYGDAKNTLATYILKYGKTGQNYDEAWGLVIEIGGVLLKKGKYDESMSIMFDYLTKVGKGGEHYVRALELITEADENAERQRDVAERIKKNLVLVSGGCFKMGDIFGDGYSDEKPVHEVCVDDFYIGNFEVTQKDWWLVMEENPSKFKVCDDCPVERVTQKDWRVIMGQKSSQFKGCDVCPVERVSWNDIQEFIRKLNGLTGKKYRLPTEAEWEYAARSGGRKAKWAGMRNDVELGVYAWYYKNSSKKTHPVGQKKPNSLGLHDMSGNVWEWVQDWYGEDYYKSSPRQNPKGPSSGEYKVLRGGSWVNTHGGVRAADRYWTKPDYGNTNRGFRLSLSAQD